MAVWAGMAMWIGCSWHDFHGFIGLTVAVALLNYFLEFIVFVGLDPLCIMDIFIVENLDIGNQLLVKRLQF